MQHTIRTRLGAALAVASLTTLPVTATATASPVPEGATEDAQLLLLLDSSGSMADPDADGTPKIDTARAALTDVIDGLDPGQHVGLRVFGGDVPIDQPREAKCTDSQLVVPIGTDNADALTAAVTDYTPTGETPIAYALQQAADDLGDTGNRTVLLVSDGIATCDPDPCDVAEELTADGLDLVVHTVGLGVDDATRTQLQCIAEAGGGTYYDTDDTGTLTTALTRITTRAFRPFSISGTPVEGTTDPDRAPTLVPGQQYTDTLAERESTAKHYLIERSRERSRIYLGATVRSERPAGISSYDVRLETPDGEACGWSHATLTSVGLGSSFGSAGTSTEQGHADACRDSDTLVAVVRPQANSSQILGQPVELVVQEVPIPVDEDTLPGRAPAPEWSDLEVGDVVDDVAGSPSLTGATPLSPGATYASDLVPGEIAFFQVPVDYGQGLQALVDVPEDPEQSIATVDVAIHSPQRASVHNVLTDTGLRERIMLQLDESRAAAVMPEVRWHNNPQLEPTLAGDYLISVSYSSESTELVPLPFTLTTSLIGEPSGTPLFEDQQEQAVSTTDGDAADQTSGTGGVSTEPPTTPAAAPTGPAQTPGTTGTTIVVLADDGEEGAGLPVAVWVLGALGVLLVAAGALLLGRRRT